MLRIKKLMNVIIQIVMILDLVNVLKVTMLKFVLNKVMMFRTLRMEMMIRKIMLC